VYLWDLAREEHAVWLAEGLGEGSWEEYQSRLAGAERALREAGHRVEVVKLSVAQMLSALREIGQGNTPQGRASAVGLAAMRKKGYSP